MIRQRNETLIIQDTLDHFGAIVDGIVVFDDASTDDSVAKVLRHSSVIAVLRNSEWRSDRESEETRHRQALLEYARTYDPKWLFYADADERFEGDIRNFLLAPAADSLGGVRIRLFDAYMTPGDHQPYTGGPLLNFRKSFGPERRDILMIWRNHPGVVFAGRDAREPRGIDRDIVTKFYCQHYGKALSIEHWEDTCNYYATHFPKYAEKWAARRGRALHHESDFGTPLYPWPEVKQHAIVIHPS